MKSLAIDTTIENKEEAKRWTKLFIAVYNNGNNTFYLKDLQEAVSKLPPELELVLIQKYELFEVDEDLKEVTPQELSKALEALRFLDKGETAYSTSAKIDHLLKEQDNVLLHNDYVKEWDIEIRDLNISTRTKHALIWSGINTLNDLFSTRYKDIVKIRYIGKKTLEEEILPLFAQYGIEPLNY